MQHVTVVKSGHVIIDVAASFSSSMSVEALLPAASWALRATNAAPIRNAHMALTASNRRSYRRVTRSRCARASRGG